MLSNILISVGLFGLLTWSSWALSLRDVPCVEPPSTVHIGAHDELFIPGPLSLSPQLSFVSGLFLVF